MFVSPVGSRILTMTLCVSLLVACCASITIEVGQDMGKDAILGLKDGMSKKAVSGMLGEPMTVGRSAIGQETWGYYYLRTKLPVKGKAPLNLQRVTLSFDGDAVASIEYDLSEPE
ncbi:MAG: outer membrane protein assembly factor BamE [Desulfobacterales bacterium]|nr:outer membrane protein assembly factor BamE [Desulfobacterales bacterium]